MDGTREKLKGVFLKTLSGLNEADFDFNKQRQEFENWDSLSHMQLFSEIESVFGVSFEMDEIIEIDKPEDVVSLIQKKQNG